MAHDAAAVPPSRAAKRRNWRNRSLRARPDLSAEEAAEREAKRLAKLRRENLYIQVTAAEKEELKQRAKKTARSMSDYARIVLLSELKAPAPAERDPDAIRALAFQLSKIGTNLNQLARVANETRHLPREAELKDVAERIVAAIEKVLTL